MVPALAAGVGDAPALRGNSTIGGFSPAGVSPCSRRPCSQRCWRDTPLAGQEATSSGKAKGAEGEGQRCRDTHGGSGQPALSSALELPGV